MTTRKPKSDYAILAVTNAMRLLEAFHESDEIGVAELARRLGLHKNNVFRLLATLEQSGYIEQSRANERYRLGARCQFVGQAFARGQRILSRARPLLERLVAETGETAHLAVLDSRVFRAVHLDGEAPAREIAAQLRIGRALPLHCTALGKALLGCSPEQRWREYDERELASAGLARRTSRTVGDPDKFFDELRSVAARGYAYDFGEFEDGLGCVAAPVHDAEGDVVAAFSVSALLFRQGDDGLRDALRSSVERAASELSRALGYLAA